MHGQIIYGKGEFGLSLPQLITEEAVTHGELTLLALIFTTYSTTFIIYSIIGWLYESTLVSIRSRKLVNRGFLTGPVIPIYGLGATTLIIALNPLSETIPPFS